MNAPIEVSHLSKSFKRYRPDRPHTFQEVLARGLKGLRGNERFWALDDISFSVQRGRTVGIIGANGSGKSTLLRLVGGVGKPDRGFASVSGRIGALFDLRSGFHTDLSGRENAILSGVLNGLTRREARRRLGEVIAFAEIEPFIDNPMRTYSSGMQMRLAFSAAVHTDPEVLLIDEVLAVGDMAFQRKCLARFSEFKARGCAMLIVSHGMPVVERLCDEVIWLHLGKLVMQGQASDVVRHYSEFMRQTGPQAQEPSRAQPLRPDAALVITAVRFLDVAGAPVRNLQSGQPLHVSLEFTVGPGIHEPLFRVRITREDGLACVDVRTEPSPGTARAGTATRLRLALDRVDLNTGRYRIDVWGYAIDWLHADDHWMGLVPISGEEVQDAVLNVPYRWELAEVPAGEPDRLPEPSGVQP